MTSEFRINFDQWLPDLPAFENPGLVEAKNLVPQAKGYAPLRGLSTFGDQFASAVVGSTWVRDSSGAIVNIAGTASTLEYLSGSTWTDVSKGGGYSGITRWEFAQFGDDVIAVAAGQAPQYSSISSGTPATFNDLGGSPPQAAHIAVVKDFVVLGNLASAPATIQWSAYNDATSWTASRTTQAASQVLYGRGGRIQKIVPGSVGTIFQENAIRVMEYVGPPVIFRIIEVSNDRGTPAPDSVCWYGNRIFFYSSDGFFEYAAGGLKPIGTQRVNTWFKNQADPSVVDTMVGAVDAEREIVVWAFRSSSSLSYNDQLLIYHYGVDRWSRAEVNLTYIAPYRSSGYHLDNIGAALPADNIETNSIPVDSTAYLGGAIGVLAFSSTNYAATFEGTALPCQIETGEFTAGGGQRAMISSVRPLVLASSDPSMTVCLGGRDTLYSNVSYTPEQTLNRLGEAPFHSDKRYNRVKISSSQSDGHFVGVDVISRPSGRQ